MSALILILAFLTSFDAESGYFENGILPQAFTVFLVIQAIVALLCASAFPGDHLLKTPDEIEDENPLIAIIGTVLIILAMAGTLFNLRSVEIYSLLPQAGICFFGLHLLTVAIGRSYEYRFLKLITLYLSILFPVTMFLDNNSYYGRHINSVENLLTSASIIAFLLYIICEGRRIALGVHSRWHLSSMAIAFSTGMSFSVAYILSYLLGAVNEDERAFEMLIVLFICAYIFIEAKRFVREVEALPVPEPVAAPIPVEQELPAENDAREVAETEETEPTDEGQEILPETESTDENQETE